MGWTVWEWTRLDEGEQRYWLYWYNHKMEKLANKANAKA